MFDFVIEKPVMPDKRNFVDVDGILAEVDYVLAMDEFYDKMREYRTNEERREHAKMMGKVY